MSCSLSFSYKASSNPLLPVPVPVLKKGTERNPIPNQNEKGQGQKE